MHINARWCLTDNRRSLVTDHASSTKQRAAFNALMLTDAVAVLWSELLLQLTDLPLPVSEYYDKWPSAGRVSDAFWQTILTPLYQQLSLRPVLRILDDSVCLFPGHNPRTSAAPRWSTSQGVVFPLGSSSVLPARARVGGPNDGADESQRSPRAEASLRASWAVVAAAQKVLARVTAGRPRAHAGDLYAIVRRWIAANGAISTLLARDGADWVTAAPPRVFRELKLAASKKADPQPQYLQPEHVRRYLQGKMDGIDTRPDGSLAPSDIRVLPTLPGNPGAYRLLLRSCMEDLSLTEADARKLVGLPLLLLESGTVRAFGAPLAQPGAHMAILDSPDARALLCGDSAGQAMAREHDLFVDKSLSTILRPWATHADTARILGLSTLTPALLQRVLQLVLPS